MKKSTLLSFLTVATVITTTAGTYAVWDTLETETSSSVTFRNPVTVEVNQALKLTENQSTLADPTAEGTVSFTISNDKDLASQLKIKPSVSGDSATIDKFDIEIIDTNDSTRKLPGTKEDGFTDNTLTSTEYTVKVTPKNKDVANKAVSITLTATLE